MTMVFYWRVSPLLYRLPILLVILDLASLVNTAGGDEDCDGISWCVRCSGENRTGCTGGCSQLVVLRPAHCPHPCPPGYTPTPSQISHFMASTTCTRGGSTVSGEAVGVSVGLGVCLVGALAVFLYCRIKRTRKPPPSLTHSSHGSEESECMEFVKQVGELRGEAPVFLAMLNDTRRQVRALRSHSALQPYKPVLKDLSRILILLNRTEERLGGPPPDWETLLAWAHRVLNRYKKHHPNQVNELVNFLSGGGGSGLSVFDTNYNTRKSCVEWDTSELDDFFTLGFRPQDEITTEL